MKTVRVYKLKFPDVGGGKWMVFEPGQRGLNEELEGGEVGDKFEIEISEMTKEALDALPEFEGW